MATFLNRGFGMSFLDVLACSLGATILLFLVFSRSMQFDSQSADTSGQEHADHTAYSAIQAGDQLELDGKMIALRMVSISTRPEVFDVLINNPQIAEWENSGALRQEYYVHNNTIVYTLSSDTLMPSRITFRLNQAPLSESAKHLINQNGRVDATIMEGAAFKGKDEVFTGLIRSQPPSQEVILKDLRVVFRLGEVDETGRTNTNLIRIDDRGR